jgi:hypothetical protein
MQVLHVGTYEKCAAKKRVAWISKIKAHIRSVISTVFLLCYTEHDNKSSSITSLCFVPVGMTTEVPNNVSTVVTNVKSVAMSFRSSNPKQERYFMYTLLTNTEDVHSFNQVKASTDRRLVKKNR